MSSVGITIGTERFGVGWITCWPRIALGVSVELEPRFAHLAIHTPLGVLIVGHVGHATSAQ